MLVGHLLKIFLDRLLPQLLQTRSRVLGAIWLINFRKPILPAYNVDRVVWVSFCLELLAFLNMRHQLGSEKLRWNFLLNRGKNEGAAVEVSDVAKSHADCLFPCRLVLICKLIELGANDDAGNKQRIHFCAILVLMPLLTLLL